MYGEEEHNGDDDAEEDKDTESFSQGEEEQDDCKGEQIGQSLYFYSIN